MKRIIKSGNLVTRSDRQFFEYCKKQGIETTGYGRKFPRKFPMEERLEILRYMVSVGLGSSLIRRTLEEEEIYSKYV